MIAQLRKKFIFIMMTVITLILIIIFSILCFFSYRQMENEIDQALTLALNDQGKKPLLEFSNDASRTYSNVPYFTVIVDEENTIIQLYSNHYEIDTNDLQSMIDTIQTSDQNKGVLQDNFVYQKQPDIFGNSYIAIADAEGIRTQTISYCLWALLVVCISFVAFFIFTFLLSRWVLRPVETAWTQQKQFIADASHELKTPLTVILADTDILLKKAQGKDDKKWLSSIQSEALRMKKLVESLLFLARNDAKQPLIRQQICSLSEIAWNCALPFEAIAFEHDQAFTYEIDEDLFVIGNEDQLRQLILIFLDNAVKYTPVKEKIFFSLHRKNNLLQMKIHNTGSYLTKEECSHLFDRFYRCDKSRTQQQGYGLGLSIAKQIAQQHHIQISVFSEKETGTTFTLSFMAHQKKHEKTDL